MRKKRIRKRKLATYIFCKPRPYYWVTTLKGRRKGDREKKGKGESGKEGKSKEEGGEGVWKKEGGGERVGRSGRIRKM